MSIAYVLHQGGASYAWPAPAAVLYTGVPYRSGPCPRRCWTPPHPSHRAIPVPGRALAGVVKVHGQGTPGARVFPPPYAGSCAPQLAECLLGGQDVSLILQECPWRCSTPHRQAGYGEAKPWHKTCFTLSAGAHGAGATEAEPRSARPIPVALTAMIWRYTR